MTGPPLLVSLASVRIHSFARVSLLLLGLSACPPTDDPNPTPDGGEQDEDPGAVSGQLTLAPLSEFGAGTPVPGPADVTASGKLQVGTPGATLAQGIATDPALARLSKSPPRDLFSRFGEIQTPPQPARPQLGNIIPGEVLVQRRPRTPGLKVGAVQALRMPELDVRLEALPPPSSRVEHLRARRPDGAPLNAEETLALATRLNDHPDYLSAEPNRRVYAQALPDDRHIALQWHLPSMSLPEAWDLQTDASDIVVAVLDTGIINHADLGSNVIPGADLISDPTSAGDGNGRDQDPTDEGGDNPNGGSSWHGTHVAGTIGADTNNGRGIAGVAWSVNILPVRVLGRDGGTTADIVAGIEWAMGRPVSGLTTNPRPADVLNLSLGGDGAPSAAVQSAIDSAVAQGAIFAVAAGNENEDTARKFPCNQQRVICVGASKPNTRRASYSNFGAEVTLMAPGGEVAEDTNGDGYGDGVLSTARGSDGADAYLFYNGTSMATPHVAGLLALMKQARRDASLSELTHAEASAMLAQTAIPGAQCNEGCGAGLVNAHGAILAALGQAQPSGPGRLSVATTRLTLRDQTPSEFLVSNYGGEPVGVTAAFSPLSGGLELDFPDGASFTLQPGTSRTVSVRVRTSGLPDGAYEGTLALTPSVGTPIFISVRIRIGPAPGEGRDALIIFMYLDENEEWQAETGGLVTNAYEYRYRGEVPPGEYVVVAAVDEDGDGEYLEDGERYGFYPTNESPEFITVRSGDEVTGIDFTLSPYRELSGEGSDIGEVCDNHGECNGVCLDLGPGYCSVDCTSAGSAACPVGSTCYAFSSGGEEVGYCLADCASPGGQSTCRAGQTCEASQSGKGYCMPD